MPVRPMMYLLLFDIFVFDEAAIVDPKEAQDLAHQGCLEGGVALAPGTAFEFDIQPRIGRGADGVDVYCELGVAVGDVQTLAVLGDGDDLIGLEVFAVEAFGVVGRCGVAGARQLHGRVVLDALGGLGQGQGVVGRCASVGIDAMVFTQADAALGAVVPDEVGIVLGALILANDREWGSVEDGADGDGVGGVYFGLDLDFEYLAGLDGADSQDFVEEVFFAVGEEGVDVVRNTARLA